MMTLEEIEVIQSPACNKCRVKRLDLFGSVACGVASTDSDVDLLVEFEGPDQKLSERCFGWPHYFENTYRLYH